MARLEVTTEGKIYVIRYIHREMVLNMLRGHAVEVVDLDATTVDSPEPVEAETGLTEEADPNVAEPEGDQVEPQNDGDFTRGAATLIAEHDLDGRLIPGRKTDGKVTVDEVRTYLLK